MKVKLVLLFAASLLVGIGSAHAQSLSCVVKSLGFPSPTPPGNPVVKWSVPSGTCVESSGATGRLRWDDNGSGELELFDTDDAGALLWCAHLHDTGTTCAIGVSFCLQSDGNAVIYDGFNCAGSVVWSSKTVGDNINGEEMKVDDNFSDCHGVSFLGEKAIILNNANSTRPCIVFSSTSSDPT